MEYELDFRTDPSQSIEGKGIAARRYDTFLDANLQEIVDSLDLYDADPPPRLQDYDDDIRDEIAAWATERSELIGFWVSWHLAGGFKQLEAGGWHRATIFRKVHRFRAEFGSHPDQYAFPWLKGLAGRHQTPARRPRSGLTLNRAGSGT